MDQPRGPRRPLRLSRPLSYCSFALAILWAIAPRVGLAETPASPQPELTAEHERFFEEKVRPLLAARCIECHGPDKQESSLRIDSREALLTGGDSGPALELGETPGGLLLQAIGYEGDIQMPPDAKLPDAELETLATWVKLGAPWPAAAAQAKQLTADEKFAQAKQSHWAFRPIKKVEPPAVATGCWNESPIDRFVWAKLAEKGLAPSPPADRRTLLRRATFDLLGIPPTPAEIAAFEQDASPEAFAKVVDRLLASPLYGQRWGRHWLDVARYADTKGYAFGRERRYAFAYTYRDYVIRSFNQDLPYDRFLQEQIAADLLPDRKENLPLAALGFLTLGRMFENVHDTYDDRIDVVTRGLMGLTVSCARCHDHKFDPIPAADYYSLHGVFASSTEPAEQPLLEEAQPHPQRAEYEAELAKRVQAREEFLAEEHRKLLDDLRSHAADYLVAIVREQPNMQQLTMPDLSFSPGEVRPGMVDRWRSFLGGRLKEDDLVFGPWQRLSQLSAEGFAAAAEPLVKQWAAGQTPAPFHAAIVRELAEHPPATLFAVADAYGKVFRALYEKYQPAEGETTAKAPEAGDEPLWQILFADGTPTALTLAEAPTFFERSAANKNTELQKKIEEHQVHHAGAPPRAMSMVEGAAVDPVVFLRGNPGRPGDKVPRRFLRILSGDDRQPFQQGSGRLELARAITSPDNPLTPRVMANRVWMHHLGTPLVLTPGDFGVRSEPPTHPELLDYLAATFVEQGWSVKKLHRLILLSQTYQQASTERPDCAAIDPENRLLYRANRRRLELEPLRDALLAVSGKLDPTLEGRPFELSGEPFVHRRTVYGLIDRQDLPSLFRVFDFASPDASTPERPRTTVPQQALFLMNSPFVVEQAKALAARPEMAAGEPPDRVNALYRTVLGRLPDEMERQLALEYLSSGGGDPFDASGGLSRFEQVAQAVLMTSEFKFLD